MDVVVRSLTDEIKKKFTEVRIFKFLNGPSPASFLFIFTHVYIIKL